MNRRIVLSTLIVIGVLSIGANSSQEIKQVALDAAKIEVVKDNLYVITGSSPANRDAFSGGNTGVFVTSQGVTLVDTKLPGWGQALLDRIKTVTDKPVVNIINTHTHGDHVGSNDFFPETVNIIAHENTKANMERMDAFKGEHTKYLPGQTYQDKLSLGTGKDKIELYYFGPGHTDGDTFIVYPALQVLQTGDMFPWRDAPFLDRNNGGSGVEYPKTLARLLSSIKNVDTVIPGHIPVTTWEELEEYQRFLADLLSAVQDAKMSGKSVDDAAAAIDLTEKYPGYKAERVKAAIEAIYDELGE